jgi:acetyl/propionyl-CoA carboxylase alpha subunit
MGHAIECRLYAENPTKMFLPSPGTLETLILPQATDSVRVETGVMEGDVVTPYYDPMLVKLICSSGTRGESLIMMAQALAATKIEGIANNVSFLEKIVRHRDFKNGDTFTGFIDEHRAALIG